MKTGSKHSIAARQRMSEATKAAWARKDDLAGQPKQRRETRAAQALREVPRDPLEAALFGSQP